MAPQNVTLGILAPQMSHREQLVEPPSPPVTVEESCNVMMEKIADYLNGELSGK